MTATIIEAEGERIGARIRVSNRMEARLSGYNFEITAITPELQAVSRSAVTEWKWEIRPKKDGQQYLHLTLSALINVEGTSTPKAIRTFDRIINVEITWSQKAKVFFKNNWQWLWAAILVPVFGLIWKKRKMQKQTKQFAPLEVRDNEEVRFFSWRGRDPIHLIISEEPPRQLFDFFIPLCEKLRQESGMEPQFNLQNNISGEVVYELSADFRSRWKLLGGRNGAAGDQLLVLVPK